MITGIVLLLIVASKLVIASLVMSGVMYLLILRVFPLYKADVGFLHIAPKFIVISIVGVTVFFVLAKILRVAQADIVLKRVLHPVKVLRRGRF